MSTVHWSTGDQLLLAYHERYPGATARAFADGRLEDGRSSYDLLACMVEPGEDILDLGCGDGHLIELMAARGVDPRRLVGVDMSEAELAAARARRGLARVRLLCERAQATTLPDASLDCVVSHLALMLMSDIESVIAELARILRPGGRLAAVVGGGPGERDAYERFRERLHVELVRSGVQSPSIGDRRTRDPAGLASLFHPGTGFEPAIDVSAHIIRLDATAERVWEILSEVYQRMVLPPDAVARLRTDLLRDVAALADATGLVPCTMRLLQFTATRSSQNRSSMR